MNNNNNNTSNRHDTFNVLFCGSSGYEPTLCKYRRGGSSHQSWDELRSIICDAWGPARFNYECKGMALPVNSQATFVQFLERMDRGEVDSVVTQNNGQTSHPVLRCMLISQQDQNNNNHSNQRQKSESSFGYLTQDRTFGLNVSSSTNRNNNEEENDQKQQQQQQQLSSPLRSFHGSSSGAGVLRPSKPKTENPSSTVINRVHDYSSSSQQQQQNVFTTTKTNTNTKMPSSSTSTSFKNVQNYNDENDSSSSLAAPPPPHQREEDDALNETQPGVDDSSSEQNNNKNKSSNNTTTNQDSVVLAVRTEVPPICTNVRVDQGGLIGNLRNHIRDMALKNAKADLPANFLLSFTRPDCESNIDVEDDGDFNFLKASIKKMGAESIVLFADVAGGPGNATTTSMNSNSNVTINAERMMMNENRDNNNTSATFSSPLKRNPFAPNPNGSRVSNPMQEASKHLL